MPSAGCNVIVVLAAVWTVTETVTQVDEENYERVREEPSSSDFEVLLLADTRSVRLVEICLYEVSFHKQ